MQRTSVKICGLQNVEVLESIIKLPIDYIGFVFALSRRQVTAKQAGEMSRWMRSVSGHRPVPLSAGVFVNPSEQELTVIMKESPLDVVQLHGEETPQFLRWVKDTFQVQTIKSWSAAKARTDNEIYSLLEPYRQGIDILLLDTAGGGTGKTFNWSSIHLYKKWANQAGVKLMVAGGLNPDNVGELISTYRPDAVDVSSGVETDGRKDTTKIASFVERVKHIG